MKNNLTRTGPPGNPKEHFDRNMLREAQIRQLYSQVRPGVFGGIAAAAILTLALWNVAPHGILIAWFLCLILVQIVRLGLASAFNRSAPTGDATFSWGRRLALTSSAAAVTWGLSAILLFPEHSLAHQFLICALLVGVAAFVAVSFAPRPESCVPAILLVLTPLAGRYIYEGGDVQFIIGIVALVFAAALLGIARVSHKLVSESIMLRFQNNHLIASLETARDDLQERIDERTVELLEANTQLRMEIAERTKAEHALLEGEQKYRGLFNDSRDAIFVTSRDGTLSDCNQSFIEIFSFEGQEMQGMNVRSLYVDPGARERFQESVEIMGYVKDYPVTLRKMDGSEMECILTASVRKAGDGTVCGYYGLIRDVTEQKRSEEALRFEREQLLSIFESISETIYVSDPYTYEVLYMNKFGKELLGTDPVGKVCYKEFQGLDQPCDFCTNKIILERKGEPYQWEHHNPVVEHDYALVDRIIRWPDGRDVRFELTIDITDRKQAEEKLRKSEEKYRTIIETIADGYYESDLKGNLTLFNDSLCEIMGYSREELMGMDYRQLMDESNAKQVFQAYNRVFSTGKVDKGFQYELTRKDRSKRQVSVSIALIRDSDGNPSGFRGIIRDITEKVQLQERLRQAGKMEAIGLLAGGVAHDFNNILTAIIGYSDVLLQQIPIEAPYRDKVAQISRAGARAASLTRQLLAFGRKQMLDVTVLDINALISDLESMLRRLIGEDIELATAYDPYLEKVNADQSQVEQILLNLAVNARDAMPSGGKLTMETANVLLDEEYARRHAEVKSGTYVMFAVSDTGHGMTPDVLSRAFDPFFTTKGTGRGTGLGLSTVYGIVKQHQGHISVYSEPSRGTTFKVYLPRAEEPITRALKAPAARVGLRGKETVFVVEDDEILLNLATEVLEMLGYSVLKASGSDEALRIGGQHQGSIHLLLTDVVLPQMDGKTLFTRLSPAFPEMKVLYMSGYAENAIVHHGVLEPGVNFLQKPFSVEGLAKRVREVLVQT